MAAELCDGGKERQGAQHQVVAGAAPGDLQMARAGSAERAYGAPKPAKAVRLRHHSVELARKLHKLHIHIP